MMNFCDELFFRRGMTKIDKFLVAGWTGSRSPNLMYMLFSFLFIDDNILSKDAIVTIAIYNYIKKLYLQYIKSPKLY